MSRGIVNLKDERQRRRRGGGGGKGGGEVGGTNPAYILDRDGKPRANVANAITCMTSAKEWEGLIGLDDFATRVVFLKPAPWQRQSTGEGASPLTDYDLIRLAEWLQHRGINVGMDIAAQAVEVLARQATFHPIRDHLEKLQWDQRPRIDRWLSYYLGAEDSPYMRAVGARWLISAVARVYQPGCKADCMLVLEGPQGLQKSAALKVLGQPWFTDEISALGTKDASLQAIGVWVIEIAELEGIRGRAVEEVKAFISRATDRFRPPYGRHLIDAKRQCIFAGSTNGRAYLRDETGGRRTWPVACGAIDLTALTHDRDQLWAEALLRYRSGERWWLHEADLVAAAREEQAARLEGDPWHETVERYVMASQDTSVPDVLRYGIRLPAESEWEQKDQNRVAGILIALGWERYRARNPDGTRPWRYRRGIGPGGPSMEDA